jgi:hypothetical protein
MPTTSTTKKPRVPPLVTGVLPYDADVWAWQNGTLGNQWLAGFFDGDLSTNGIPGWVKSVLPENDIHFTFPPNTYLSSVDIYKVAGTIETPIEFLYREVGGEPIPFGQFDIPGFRTWKNYALPRTVLIAEIIFRVKGYQALFPGQIKWNGAQPVQKPIALPFVPTALATQFNIVTYWFNTLDVRNATGPPDPSKVAQLDYFGGFRYFDQVSNLKGSPGFRNVDDTYNFSGNISTDSINQYWHDKGKSVLHCLCGNFPEYLATYPDPSKAGSASWAYKSDPFNPESYRLLGEAVFQVTARDGSVEVPFDLLKAATKKYNAWDKETPVKRTGTGLLKRWQVLNEAAKYWEGIDIYREPRAAAVIWSVILDGHKGTMGPGVGNADPSLELIPGLLFVPDPGFMRGFYSCLAELRGRNADGSINGAPTCICFHAYSVNAAKQGVPFEESAAAHLLPALRQVLQLFAPKTTVIKTEYGYSYNPTASQAYVQPSQSLTSEQRAAAFIVGDALWMGRHGVQESYLYDDLPHGGVAAAYRNGAPWNLSCDNIGKPSQKYAKQVITLSTGYVLADFLDIPADPGFILCNRYTKPGAPDLLAFWLTKGADRSVDYVIQLTKKSTLYQLDGTADTPITRALPSGESTITVTETPCFVLGNLRKPRTLALLKKKLAL